MKIGYLDLFATIARSLTTTDRNAEQARAESYFSPESPAIACYSVRSGLDLLLQGLNLQPGDEVVFSALNVRAMVKVVNNLGLVPVPVDIDTQTMQPKMDKLKAALTPRSKVFVVAHLFGTRLNLGECFSYARSKGLLNVEDCAQAFNGKTYTGSELADVVMYSFGPIKTATALGGALLTVKDQSLRDRLRVIQNTYAAQEDKKHRNRAVKFIALKFVTSPPVLGAIYRYYKARGRNYEDSLADRVRDVAPLKTVDKMRIRPSGLMLWLMNRRLANFDLESIERRAEKGRALTARIRQKSNVPGQTNTHHDYWVYPILAVRPKQLIERLREQGFDAADLPRSQHISAPPDRTDLEPVEAAALMRDIVIVPCYEAMPDSEIARLADVIRDHNELVRA